MKRTSIEDSETLAEDKVCEKDGTRRESIGSTHPRYKSIQKNTPMEREECTRSEPEGHDASEGREAGRKTTQGKLVS